MPSRSLPFALGAVVSLVVCGGAVLSGLLAGPAPVASMPVHCDADLPTLQAGQSLRVLVWNLQFAGTTKHQFFYDDGEAVHVPPGDVTWALDEIAKVIAEVDPDIMLLQEIDRGSDRTGRVEQLAELTSRLKTRCYTAAPYHQVFYVPTPAHDHLGRVDLNLAVFSKVQLGAAPRHQLALLDEPLWRQLFNLRRAALVVEVPVAGGPDLTLIDTHLSAFSHGDGTLARQVGQVRGLALGEADAGKAVLLAGDFNLLVPGDDPARLPEWDQALYSDAENPIEALYQDLQPAVPLDRLRSDPERYYTYAPFGQGRTDRTIDHVFTAGPVRVDRLQVRHDRLDISDHQPIIVDITLGSTSGAP